MSLLESTISGTLLPGLTGSSAREKWLNCTRDYPWYPLPWLMLAKTDQEAFFQKANLWFDDEQRIHWLLHSKPWQEDEWLKAHFNLQNDTAMYHTDNDQNITITEENIEDNKQAFITINSGQDLQGSIVSPDKGTNDLKIDYSTDLQSNTELTKQKVHSDPSVEALEKKSGREDRPAQAQSPVLVNTSVTENNKSNAANLSPAEPLAFEPYHSVDYFASQGIKLTLPAEPKDKFDRQLKSFTQWLQVMKKVAVTESNAFADPAVEAQANESVSGKEIITEAMAMVLEKQGKYQKAVDIYEKLLLLHPEKSTFFAARIEELKNKQ